MMNKRPRTVFEGEASHINYIKTLKEAIDPHEFEQFKLSLKDFDKGRICTSQLLASIHESVGRDQDLLAGVNVFIPMDYKIKPNYGQYNWFSIKKASVDFFNNVRLAYRHDNDATYKSFLNIIKRVLEAEDKNQFVDRKRVFEEVDDLFKDRPEFPIEFTRLFVDGSGQTNKRVRCTDFKKKEHSVDEQRVFELEDFLYERDMLRHYYESAIKRSDEFLCEYSDTRDCDVPIGAVKKYFSSRDVRVIKKMYGDRGDEFVEWLWQKPISALKKIVPRLRQKHEELNRNPEDLRRKCQKVFRKMNKNLKADEQGRNGKEVVIYRHSVSGENRISRSQSPELEEGGEGMGEEEEKRSDRDKAESLVTDLGCSRTNSVDNSGNSDSST